MLIGSSTAITTRTETMKCNFLRELPPRRVSIRFKVAEKKEDLEIMGYNQQNVEETSQSLSLDQNIQLIPASTNILTTNELKS